MARRLGPALLASNAPMKKLRSLHLYLGCVFAPLLLFFAASGIWQTYDPDYAYHSKLLGELSTIHRGSSLKSGFTLSSAVLRDFILLMAVGFIITTVLGVIMAVTQGGNRKRAYYCLAFGVLFPLAVIVISYLSR
jgi:hypothetical protein